MERLFRKLISVRLDGSKACYDGFRHRRIQEEQHDILGTAIIEAIYSIMKIPHQPESAEYDGLFYPCTEVNTSFMLAHILK